MVNPAGGNQIHLQRALLITTGRCPFFLIVARKITVGNAPVSSFSVDCSSAPAFEKPLIGKTPQLRAFGT